MIARMCGKVLDRFVAGYMMGPSHPVARRLREGDEVGGFTVLEVPGHTPGHVAFWREKDRVLVLGDVVTNMKVSLLLPGLHEPPRVRPSMRPRTAVRPGAGRYAQHHCSPRAALEHSAIHREFVDRMSSNHPATIGERNGKGSRLAPMACEAPALTLMRQTKRDARPHGRWVLPLRRRLLPRTACLEADRHGFEGHPFRALEAVESRGVEPEAIARFRLQADRDGPDRPGGVIRRLADDFGKLHWIADQGPGAFSWAGRRIRGSASARFDSCAPSDGLTEITLGPAGSAPCPTVDLARSLKKATMRGAKDSRVG